MSYKTNDTPELKSASFHVRLWGTTTYKQGQHTIVDNIELKLHRTIVENDASQEAKVHKRSMGS